MNILRFINSKYLNAKSGLLVNFKLILILEIFKKFNFKKLSAIKWKYTLNPALLNLKIIMQQKLINNFKYFKLFK